MSGNKISQLLVSLYELICFSPIKLLLLFTLILLQRITAGIGLLLLIPLLNVIGFDTGVSSASNVVTWTQFVSQRLGFELDLPNVLLVYVLTISFVACLHYYQTVLTSLLQQSYVRHKRHKLFDAVLHSNWEFFISRKNSEFVYALTQQVNAIGQSAQLTLGLISQLVLISIYIALSFVLSWKLTLLATICALILMVMIWPLNNALVRSGQYLLSGNKNLMQRFTEQLASLKMIKSYGGERLYLSDMQRENRSIETQNVKLARSNAITRLVISIGGVTAFATCFYVAIVHLHVSLATLLILLFIFSRLMPQVTTLQSQYQRLLHLLPALADVKKTLNDCLTMTEHKTGQATKALEIKNGITLSDVHYRYADTQKPVINGLSVFIKKNTTIAIVGPSGSGKSTLADLIAGLLVPQKGYIKCDDIILDGSNINAWRRSVAYVTQESYLFHDTIRSNLEWVVPEVSDAQIWEALELSMASDFVAALPLGLDTIVGDRGERLSGGERQRLALARALLSKPQLLILDEATSALDTQNELKIQRALQALEGKVTVVMISHRDAAIRHVTHRITLSQPLQS